MPFGPYDSMSDCISKNQDKDDPAAWCAQTHYNITGKWPSEEAYRHRDFSRIYDEFITYYKDAAKGEGEYYQWLNALGLNEEKEYAFAAESFQWAKDDIHFLREDADNKYYGVLVGFPITSMNGNVYHERDLIAAALSIKGKHPSLNHEDKYWFSPNNPRNRWGNIPVVGAKYEDGAVEAIIQVPKDMTCPICDGAPMTELIDNRRIVNVSLEGTCAVGDITGDCEGFQFGDPPFSFLTTDILPGIPLARITPLEHIMVEALHPSTRKKTLRIKLKLKEEDDEDEIKPGSRYCDEHPDDPRCKAHKKAIHGEQATQPEDCPEGQHWDPDEEKCVPNTEEQITEEPKCPEGEVWDPRAGECVKAETQEGAMASLPETFAATDTLDTARGSIGKVEPTLSQGRYAALGTISHTDPQTAQGDSPGMIVAHPKEKTDPDMLTHDTGPKVDVHLRPMPEPEISTPTSKDTTVEPTHTGISDQGTSYAAPESPTELPTSTPVPEAPLDQSGQELGTAKEPHTCQDGYHYDYEADMCVPDTPLTERIRRYKAEDEAREAKDHLYSEKERYERLQAVWEKRLIDAETRFQQLLGSVRQQTKRITGLNETVNRIQTEREDLRVELRQFKNDYADKVRDNKRLENMVNDFKIENATLKKKYHGQLASGLDLSKKVTKANEDWLAIARERDELREKLKRQRNLGKRIVKIKA